MKDQSRSAAASVSNNIAEGFGYGSTVAFIKFLTYAKGSAGEVYNQFTILFRAEMIDERSYIYFTNKARELGKKMGGFIQYLRTKIQK